MSEIVKLNDGSFIRIERGPFSIVTIGVIGHNLGCTIALESDEFERLLNGMIRMKEEMEG